MNLTNLTGIEAIYVILGLIAFYFIRRSYETIFKKLDKIDIKLTDYDTKITRIETTQKIKHEEYDKTLSDHSKKLSNLHCDS